MLFESAYWLPLAAALASVALAAWILVRPWAEPFHRWVAIALGLTAVVEGASAALLFLPADALVLRRIGLAAEFLRMAALFLVGAALIGRSSAEADPRAARARSWRVGGGGGRGGGGVPLGLRRDRRDGRGPGAVRPRAGRAAAARGDAPRPGARPRAARVGAAGEPRPVPLPDQVRDRGAGRPRGVRALRHVADAAARGVAGPPRGRGRAWWRSSRWASSPSGSGGCASRARSGGWPVSPQMVYGSFTLLGVGLYLLGVGLVGEALRLSGRTLSVGVAELAVFLLTLALVAGARLARGAGALPAVRVAPPAALALRLPHEVARGDGRVPLGGVGGADPRPAARRAGPDLRRRAALDLDALRGGRALPPGALDEHRAAARLRSGASTRWWPLSRSRTSRWRSRGRASRRRASSSTRRSPCSASRCAARGSSSGSCSSTPGRAAATTTWTTSTCCARSPTTRGCSSPTRGWPRTGRPRPSSTPSTASPPSTCTTSRTWRRGCRSWPRTRRSTATTRSSARRR